LPQCLIMSQARYGTQAGYAFDFNTSATMNRYVYILASGATAGSYHTTGAIQITNNLTHSHGFFRGFHVRIGNNFNQRHAQPVSAVYSFMAFVANFTTGIFFDTELANMDFSTSKRDISVSTDNGRPLETCRYTSIQILFSGDMYFANNIATKHHGNGNTAVQGQVINLKRWGIVHVVGANRVLI